MGPLADARGAESGAWSVRSTRARRQAGIAVITRRRLPMAVAAQPREVDAAAGGGISWDRPVQWGLTIVAVILVVFPLAPLVYQSFLDRPLYEAGKALTLGNYSRILSS